MEKQEKYLYISLSRRHIAYRILKRKISHHFEKFKLEIGGQCTAAVRAMGAMGGPMSGRLRQG